MFTKPSSSQAQATILHKIPQDLMPKIFSKLDANALKAARLTCQAFHYFAHFEIAADMRLSAKHSLELQKIFTKFPQLKHLGVDSLDYVGTMFLKSKNIHSLKLVNSAIGKLGMGNIKEIKELKRLEAHGCQFNDGYVDAISDMQSLQEFHSRDNKFSKIAEERLADKVPSATFDHTPLFGTQI